MATIEESAKVAAAALRSKGPHNEAAGREDPRLGAAVHAGPEDEDGEDQDNFKPLTREEALQWRASQPRTSVWAVVGWQLVLAVLAALVAAGLTRSQAVVVSLLYGSAAVVVPTAMMAWGLTKSALSKRAAGGSQASLAGFFVWEGAKLLLAIALLALAPRLVPDLSWLALVAGLVVVLKAYWLELWFRARRSK